MVGKSRAGNAVNIFYGELLFFPLGGIGDVCRNLFGNFGLPAEEVISLAGGRAAECRSGFVIFDGVALVGKSRAVNAVNIFYGIGLFCLEFCRVTGRHKKALFINNQLAFGSGCYFIVEKEVFRNLPFGEVVLAAAANGFNSNRI